MEYRTCKVCGKTKPMSEYYGKTYTCKRCVCEHNSEIKMQRNLAKYPNLPNEEWRTIPSEPEYKVSNLGRIRSFKHYGRRGEVLKCTKHHQGYLRIRLTKQSYCVHRLVAEAFIPNPEHKATVNHINGNKADNRVENLEWATQSENNYHAFRTGLKHYTEKQRRAAAKGHSFSEDIVRKVRELYSQGMQQSVIATKLNVNRPFVCRVVNGKTRTYTT